MIAAALILALLSLASAETQTPTLTSCSEDPDSDVVTISDIKISNSAYGQTMSMEYTMEITEELSEEPTLQFEMTASGGAVPCLADFGSCVYRMCEGTTEEEQQVGAPWNNECPIKPGSYHNVLNIPIPLILRNFVHEPTVHVKMQADHDVDEAGCVEFDMTIENEEE